MTIRDLIAIKELADKLIQEAQADMDCVDKATAWDKIAEKNAEIAQLRKERDAFQTGVVDAVAEIERLRAALEKAEQWADRYTLPCDVILPPNTIIRKGCRLNTLIAGLIGREPIEGEKPREFPRAVEQHAPEQTTNAPAASVDSASSSGERGPASDPGLPKSSGHR